MLWIFLFLNIIFLFLPYIYSFKLDGIKDENGTVSTATNSTHSKESFAEVGVYFQSLNKKLVYEEPKYTVRFNFERRSPI